MIVRICRRSGRAAQRSRDAPRSDRHRSPQRRRTSRRSPRRKPRHTPRLPSVAVPRYPFRDTREASDVLSGIKVIGGLALRLTDKGTTMVGGLWRRPWVGKRPTCRVSAEGLSVAVDPVLSVRFVGHHDVVTSSAPVRSEPDAVPLYNGIWLQNCQSV
jgi:hypothetical protein